MDVEITVIDDSDYVGWLAAATRTDEVYMSDVHSMVDNVMAKAGTNKISRLNILDHGNKTTMQIGKHKINVNNYLMFEGVFVKLQPYFAATGFAHFQHCNIGENYALLRLFANTWKVPVFAGTGKHNPVYRFNFGDYVRCNPDGLCTKGVSRP